MPDTRLFLERNGYRRRRMMDAVRVLPLLCAVLWVAVPTMWPNTSDAEAQTALSSAIRYLFVIWILAISITFGLWRRIRHHDEASNLSVGEEAAVPENDNPAQTRG